MAAPLGQVVRSTLPVAMQAPPQRHPREERSASQQVMVALLLRHLVLVVPSRSLAGLGRLEPPHRALGALAGRLDLARVFFLGEEGHWVREGWREESRVSFVLVKDKAALRDALAEECRAGTVLLFKASRGVGLEDVFQPLLEE